MDFNVKRKQLVHVLHQRKQHASRKRTNSFGFEEKPCTSVMKSVHNHKFVFPAPPRKPQCSITERMGHLSTSDSDTSQSDSGMYKFHGISSPVPCVHSRMKCQGYQSEGSPIPLQSVPRLLPPIGVFWDIENCQVPKGRSAVAVAEVIRKRFFTGYREAEFLVVCDVKKESNQILQELNDAQVNLIHVASMCKNAADEKLRQSMRRFADIHGSPSSIVLISGDINFAADITDLRHRKKINVILLHMENASENLILCASEHYSFSELVESLPPRGSMKQSSQPVEVLVYNLPAEKDSNSVKMRLRQLSDNCGGRVTTLKQTCATIRFASFDIAIRAQKRMEGEDVFGNKIQVSQPVKLAEKDGSPQKNLNSTYSGKKHHGTSSKDSIANWTEIPLRSTPGLYQCMPQFNLLGSNVGQQPYFGNWTLYGTTSASVNVAQEYYTGIYTGYHAPTGDPMASTSNNSPYAAFNVKNATFCPQMHFEDSSNISSDALNTSTKELRKIKGTYKDSLLIDSNITEIDINKPTSYTTSDENNSRTFVKAGSSNIIGINGRSVSPSISTDSRSKVKQSRGSERDLSRSRTPTPVLQQYDGDLDEPEHFFHPISTSDTPLGNGPDGQEAVELHVSNLDQIFGAREMKKILLNAFKEHVLVLSLLVLTQPDGSLNALVRLASQQDAQYAIYKLQRRKIGRKRINISHASASGPSPQLIRSQVISLLQDVPNHQLPLFKFCELYESRYLSSISISEICKVKECQVSDAPRGRIVSLLVDARNSPSPQLHSSQDAELLEQQFCPLHGQELQPNRGWAEQEAASLPSVNMSLKLLGVRVHALLQSHNGSIHLSSLPQCYRAQFEAMQEDKDGVSLEHLVSCLAGIEIYVSPANIKYLRWSKTLSISSNSSKTDESESSRNLNTPLAGQLAVFSRELVDLLKTSPSCQIPFDKFIPAYHHHFGRQCRVADYGFTKLIELLESLPHTVQVMGEGNRRMVTLSHRVQMRRFMGDLLRILRMQMNKQVLLSELPDAFQKVFDKPLNISSYGVCDIRDLLSDLSDASVVVSSVESSEDDLLIVIPKREQTPQEIEKTRQFALEVIDLLRHVPNCSMRFNKFIPAHHIHFGWQCRVADYGFTKLIELFEAIPDVVEIITIDGERWVCLTLERRLNVLAEQIVFLLHSAPECKLSLRALNNNYCTQYGYCLRPESFECPSMEELLNKLPNIKLMHSPDCPIVTLKNYLKVKNVHRILSEQHNCSMEFQNLARKCKERCNESLSLDEVKYMKDIEVGECNGKSIVHLSRSFVQQQFMQDVHQLVLESGGRLPLSSLESKYLERYGRPCQPAQFGFSSMGALLQTLRGSVRLRGRGTRRFVVLLEDSQADSRNSLSTSSVTIDAFNSGTENSNESFVPNSEPKGDLLSNNDGDSGHDDGSSTSAVDVDLSLSSGSKTHTSQRSSASEVLSDGSTSVNGCDPIGQQKNVTPEKASGLGFNPEASSIWCADSPPYFTPSKCPWSHRMLYQLIESDSPAVMLSPSSNLLPAFSSQKTDSSNLVACHLPPLYSYPPFLPGLVASPEPSTLPMPQLSLGGPQSQSCEVHQKSSLNESSNNSTPNRLKVKRRLAAHFPNLLDLP